MRIFAVHNTFLHYGKLRFVHVSGTDILQRVIDFFSIRIFLQYKKLYFLYMRKFVFGKFTWGYIKNLAWTYYLSKRYSLPFGKKTTAVFLVLNKVNKMYTGLTILVVYKIIITEEKTLHYRCMNSWNLSMIIHVMIWNEPLQINRTMVLIKGYLAIFKILSPRHCVTFNINENV